MTFPEIPTFVGWGWPHLLMTTEARQLGDEGRDPKWVQDYLDAALASGKSAADTWYGLQAAPVRKDNPYREPNDLEGIRKERGPGLRQRAVTLSDDALMDRMLGAWQGRCNGCILGKPVEFFAGGDGSLSIRERIRIYLQGIDPGEYPLNDYFPLHSPAEERSGKTNSPASCRENIAFVETDDDLRYTVLAQRILRAKGVSFGSLDVMAEWLNLLPYSHVATAESQAYRNYIMRFHMTFDMKDDVDWEWVATHQNPYREWIGAQIRADSWGYAAPGNPELAASLAWRDARISHIKNGIYGAMFVAAMISAAFVLDDISEVIEAGLAEIPQASRLHQYIRQTVDICCKHGCKPEAFEAVLDEIYVLFRDFSHVHTINNAALVVASLLLGGSDFEKVITIAVMGGWDTDCNGATAGSIFGALYGAQKIPAKWTERFHDTLYSQITDYHPIAISECARRSFEIAKRVIS